MGTSHRTVTSVVTMERYEIQRAVANLSLKLRPVPISIIFFTGLIPLILTLHLKFSHVHVRMRAFAQAASLTLPDVHRNKCIVLPKCSP